MFHQKLKQVLNDSIATLHSDMDSFVVNPGKDLSRVKKISADSVVSFLISQGASSSKCEILDFFQLAQDTPSASAMKQRRSQLKPEAFEAVFYTFNTSVRKLDSPINTSPYRYLAADGSTIFFFSFPRYAADEFFATQGNTARGWYVIHINAFYDLQSKTYTDAVIQSFHKHDEFAAFCQFVDRHEVIENTKNIYIGDRGYCSYNMAHVIEAGQFFLFRTKDTGKKGLIGNFNFPDTDEFDISVHVMLVRSHHRSVIVRDGTYRRFIGENVSFDFLPYGSKECYELEFRVLRFPISDSAFECVVTNLPSDDFPSSRVKETYNARWGIETSFRKLKYKIGLTSYHSYKPEHIKQEIWAKLIAYNATVILINHCVIETDRKKKYSYSINFTVAAHLCRIYLRLLTEADSVDVMALIRKELIPVRSDRQYPRPTVAHFRKPKYMIYRVA